MFFGAEDRLVADDDAAGTARTRSSIHCACRVSDPQACSNLNLVAINNDLAGIKHPAPSGLS